MTDDEAIATTLLHWSVHSKYRDRPHMSVFQRGVREEWWVYEDYVCSKMYRTQADAARAYLKHYGLLK